MATGNKISAADVANAGLGAAALVGSLTARRPRPIRPVRMASPVRVASGDEAALSRNKERIAQEAAAATRDVNRIAGSDVMSGFAARLGVQKNATDAVRDAELANSQLLKQDQVRADQAVMQQDYTNALLENQAQQTNFEVDQQQYNTTRAANAQGLNSSLNYIAQKEANVRNNEIVARQAQEQIQAIKGSAYQDAYTRAIVAGKSPEQAKEIAAESTARFGLSSGFVPGRFQ